MKIKRIMITLLSVVIGYVISHFVFDLIDFVPTFFSSSHTSAELRASQLDEKKGIGELGLFILGNDDATDKNLFNCSLDFAWECNDWNLLNALRACKSNSSVQLINYVNNSNSSELSEQYFFSVEVEDTFVRNQYTVSFDFWVNKKNEEGEYYNCNIQLNSSQVLLQEATWTSRDTERCYFELDSRPDGEMGLIGHFYWSTSYDPWETKYSTISFIPVADDWSNQPYGYKVSFNDAIQVMLYPDGTLYNNFYKLMFYPNGMEEQIKGIVLTSGNEIGTTSSNLFNGGLYAIENDVIVYHEGHSVYRSRLDGTDKMCLYTGTELDYIRSLNLINGECYFTCSGEAAYGYDLNGNQVFYVGGDLEQIIVDGTTIYYSVFRDTSKNESGLYAYNKATGNTSKLVNGSVKEIAVDGEMLYFINQNNNNLYCCKKDGTGFAQLYDKVLGPLIVENGVILFYDRNSYMLHAMIVNHNGAVQSDFDITDYTSFGGISAYVGSDITKKIAFHNGYIYYYYPEDNSMICRMTLDGNVKDQFVCYTDWAKGGIYLFGNSLYLAGEDRIYFKVELTNEKSELSVRIKDSNNEEYAYEVVEDDTKSIDGPVYEVELEEAAELDDEPVYEAIEDDGMFYGEPVIEAGSEEIAIEEDVEVIYEAEEEIEQSNQNTYDDGTWFDSDNLRDYTARIPNNPRGLTMEVIWDKPELTEVLAEFLLSDIWDSYDIWMSYSRWDESDLHWNSQVYTELDDIISIDLKEGDLAYQNIDVLFVFGVEPQEMKQTIELCRELNIGLYIASTNDPEWAIELIRNLTIGL